MSVDLYHRDAGRGAPVVLLHAFPLSSAMWLAQRETLSAGHRMITPDLRGFGGSPLGADEPSLDHMADDVAALLDAKGIERAVLGGLSMGGYVAMAVQRRHASRIAALVLADTTAAGDSAGAAANRRRIAADLDADPKSSVLLDEVLPSLVGPTTMDRRALVYGRVKALVASAPAPAAAWAERAMAARPSSLDVLASVRVPTLVVVGEEDKITPVGEAEAMTEAVSAAKLVRIPSCGHLSAVEAPETFSSALGEFLGTL